jgi:hypothetical protein
VNRAIHRHTANNWIASLGAHVSFLSEPRSRAKTDSLRAAQFFDALRAMTGHPKKYLRLLSSQGQSMTVMHSWTTTSNLVQSTSGGCMPACRHLTRLYQQYQMNKLRVIHRRSHRQLLPSYHQPLGLSPIHDHLNLLRAAPTRLPRVHIDLKYKGL